MLITFEGIDGCGKTTIINKLKDHLQISHTVYLSYEPGNIFGHLAKVGCPGLSVESSIWLWWLSRQFEQNSNEYKKSNIILKDRYFDSTLVYQDLLNFQDLFNINYNKSYFDFPDLTFIFSIDIKLALSRIKNRNLFDQFENVDIEKLTKRQNIYLDLPHIFPNRKFKIINVTDKNIDEIYNECLTTIEDTINDQN